METRLKKDPRTIRARLGIDIYIYDVELKSKQIQKLGAFVLETGPSFVLKQVQDFVASFLGGS